MTFQVTAWPRPDDVEYYASRLHVPSEAVVRDIVRIVRIAELTCNDVLNDEWVLSGGMGLRLRGSTRFTMKDTDTSRRNGPPDLRNLAEALAMEEDELIVTPADWKQWNQKPGRDLVIAEPIDYDASFADADAEGSVSGTFTFTVSWRGLFERPDKLVLRHPYRELQFSPKVIIVPVMNLTEQTAEKIVAWCVHGLMKHYVDVAWIFFALKADVDVVKLPGLVVKKLEVGRKHFPGPYGRFPNLQSLLAPLNNPDEHKAPLGGKSDGARSIRFDGARLSKADAIAIVRRDLLPALFR